MLARYALALLLFASLGCLIPPEEQGPAPEPYPIVEPDMGPDRLPEGVGAVGAPCDRDAQCADDLRCDRSQPGGYCTRQCRAGWPCEGGAVCAYPAGGREAYCFSSCAQAPCRDGYTCANDGEVQGCVPIVPPPPAPPVSFAQMTQALGADCSPARVEGAERTWSWRFTLPVDAASFMILPYTTSGQLRPRSLQTPDALVDLVADYRHHNGRARDLEVHEITTGIGRYGEVAFDWPILFPYAPQHASYVVSGGEYTLTLETSEDVAPCLIVQSDQPGSVELDLNIYLVGLLGIDAYMAQDDPALKEVISGLRAIYAQVGVKIGAVRFFDIAEEGRRYAYIREEEDIERVTAYGVPASARLDDLLSVDIFLVRDILLQDGQVLGSSGGVPGAAGMHGNANNGLVFSANALGSDNKQVALVMAHEIGHYLGLRHTTELIYGVQDPQVDAFEALMGLSDPLPDTPECPSPYQYGDRCPDRLNLMFPAIPDSSEVKPVISAGQGRVMIASPLTRR